MRESTKRPVRVHSRGMRDVLDKAGALRFAWRYVGARDAIDVSEPQAAPVAPVDESDTPEAPADSEFRRSAARKCAVVAASIDSAWRETDTQAQLNATKALAREAIRLSIEIGALSSNPLACVRLARLFVRHAPSLRAKLRDDAFASCMWLNFGHPEAIELFDEVVRAGRTKIADYIDMTADDEPLWPFDGRTFTMRLGRAFDEATSWESRVIALRWMVGGDPGASAPWLRRALRMHHVELRAIALGVLVEVLPDSLTDEDVEFLVDDLLRDPPTTESRGAADELEEYAEALFDAIVLKQPAGGMWRLYAVVERGTDPYSGVLDESWALRALAAAYPEDALDAIDVQLQHDWAIYRSQALDAIELLPEEHAKPRLLECARDPSPGVTERARAIWLQRFASTCPVGPLDALRTDLLEGPPSERLLARAIVMRSTNVEARARLASVLWREAPDAEALALLVLAAQDRDIGRGSKARSLPADRRAWTKRLVTKFGERGVKAVCALARTRPLYDHLGWFDSLAELLKSGAMKKRDAGPLRELALERLTLPETGARTHETAILAALLSPVQRFDLYLGILRAAADDEGSAYQAGSALCEIPPSQEIDTLLRALLKELLETRAYGKLAPLVSRLGDMGRVGAMKMAEQALASSKDEAAIDYLQSCAYLLRRNGRLSNEWVLARLAAPESFGFLVAVAVANADDAKTRARLMELLESPARDGKAAVSAATTLVRRRHPMRRVEPWLVRLLDRIPTAARVELLCDLVLFGAPLRPLRAFIEPLILTADTDTVLPLLEELQGSRAGERFLRELQPLATNDEVRAELSVRCGPTEQSAWTPTKEDRRRSSQRVDS
jgi:hypothetical protein